MPFSTPLVIAAATFLLGLYAVPSRAQGYTFKEVTAPNMGSTVFYSINNSKTILSEVSTSGSMACYVRKGNVQTLVADPNGGTTYCGQIDDAEVVVGFYAPPSNPNTQVGFVYTPSAGGGGTYQDFIDAKANVQNGGTQLSAISSNGIIAGSYATKEGYQIPFVIDASGAPRDIKISGQMYLIPVGINKSKQIVLQVFNAGGQFQGSLFYNQGSTTPIAFPNATRTVAHTITNAGNVVGDYADSQGLDHGFIYDTATSSFIGPIDDPNTTGGLLLLGLNDKGIVVGATAANLQTSIRLGAIGTPN